MILIQILFFLLLFIQLLCAIPMNKDIDHRMHREQSQELDETVEWDKLQPLIEIPIYEINKSTISSTSQSSFQPVTTAVPAKELEEKEIKQTRNRMSQKRYKESLKTNPEKLKARNNKQKQNRKQREEKMSKTDRQIIRRRHYMKAKEKAEKHETSKRISNHRRVLKNKINSGTESNEYTEKLIKMRERDRIYQKDRRERIKMQKKQQSSKEHPDTKTQSYKD